MASQAKAPNGLNEQQQLFVDYYLADIEMNATSAAIKAGYSEKTARQQASRLLSNVNIQQAIEQAKAERSERTKITQDDVLKMWHDLATVDYNEISQLLNVNCRYCWGVDHEYQYTPKEWQRVCESADKEQASRPPFGGDDFNHKRAPNPNCPECGGLGNATIHLHDTDRLSPQAKLAYQGAKAGKFGIEVLTTDRMKALDNIARHLGMFNDKLQMEQLGEQSVNIKISYE